MNAVLVFVVWAVVISGTFFGVLSMFELFTLEWFISDVILGVIICT